MPKCEYFGKENGNWGFGYLKACNTCEDRTACYEAILGTKPYYSVTLAIGFTVDKEYELELDDLIHKIEKYANQKAKKLETCETFDPGLGESGYYEER